MAVALLLSACGFQLRGDALTGFGTLTLTQNGPSHVAIELRRTLATGPTRLVLDPTKAEAQLRIISEAREKTIFSLTGAGRVFEHQLRLVVNYELIVPGRDEPLIPPSEIDLRRVVTFSESAPLAKEAEEQLLFRDMNIEAAGQILRRIAVMNRKG